MFYHLFIDCIIQRELNLNICSGEHVSDHKIFFRGIITVGWLVVIFSDGTFAFSPLSFLRRIPIPRFAHCVARSRETLHLCIGLAYLSSLAVESVPFQNLQLVANKVVS